MPDHEDSLGGETFSGEEQQDPAGQSLGDGATMGGGTAAHSLGDQSTFGDANTDDELFDDGMELVDLSTRYTEEDVLGKGGFGEVILATDNRLERKVAIKRIQGKAARSKTAVQRFLTEAKSIAALSHNNIVQIYDYGRATDGPFLIMECVQGGSLLDLCRKGPIELDEAVKIFIQVCDGLANAHTANIIHRDIKPANILMTEDGIPKLTDFGLAKDDTSDTGMTMEGAVIGTLDFMPPEQRKGAEFTDHRSDLWSLSATFYQMLTGKSPKVINIALLPPKLQSVVTKALEESKEDRFQSVMEMREAILQAHSGKMDASRSLGEGECPQCATPNPSGNKYCDECGASLQVKCLKCESDIAIWNKACRECGTQQDQLVKAALKALQTKHDEAEVCLNELKFDDALKAASVIGEQNDPRLQQFSAWHEEFGQRLADTRKTEDERLQELLEEAETHQENHDYEAARRSLNKVDKRLRGRKLENLGSAKSILARITAILARIKKISTANETVKEQAVAFLEEFEFDMATETARAIEADDRYPHLKEYVAWVDEFIEEVAKRRAAELIVLEGQLSQALEHEEKFDYEAGLQALTQVRPCLGSWITIGLGVSGSEDTAAKISERLTTKQTRFKELEGIVRERFSKRETAGLLRIVNELLTLKPDRPEFQRLKKQLEKRDADLLEARDIAVKQATRQLEEQQYAEAVATLNTVSEEVSSEQLEELKTNARDLLKQLNGLRETIHTAVSGNQLKGLLPVVLECLILKADQDDLVKLKQDLIDHEAKMDARNQQIISQAQTHIQQSQFDEAVQLLGAIAQEYQTSATTQLSQQAHQLSDQRQGVFSTVSAALSNKDYRVAIKNITNYLGEINCLAEIQDPELQQILDEAKEKVATSIRKKKLVMVVITAICVALMLITAVGIKINDDANAAAEKAAILAGEPITNTLDMTFNNIPAGTFMMGSTGEEHLSGKSDNKQHEVTITRDFYMQTTEVTKAQWRGLMKTEPWKEKFNVREGANSATTHVSWDDAVAYCKKLSEKEGKTYRLPTEAEWEYACRAGTATRWSFGDDTARLGDYAWCAGDLNGETYAHQVGLKKPNAFGLYDMHGNVYEWCHDYYESVYYIQSPEKDPQGPASGSFRVIRGGSWFVNLYNSRSADRSWHGAAVRIGNVGFRLVRELD